MTSMVNSAALLKLKNKNQFPESLPNLQAQVAPEVSALKERIAQLYKEEQVLRSERLRLEDQLKALPYARLFSKIHDIPIEVLEHCFKPLILADRQFARTLSLVCFKRRAVILRISWFWKNFILSDSEWPSRDQSIVRTLERLTAHVQRAKGGPMTLTIEDLATSPACRILTLILERKIEWTSISLRGRHMANFEPLLEPLDKNADGVPPHLRGIQRISLDVLYTAPLPRGL